MAGSSIDSSAPTTHEPAASSADRATQASDVVVLPQKPPGAIAFTFQVRSTGALYRVIPARHPDQPRFWCFWFYRCLRSGSIDPFERPRTDNRQLQREALAEAAREMRDDLDGWLSQADNRALRAWILGIASEAAALRDT